MDIPNHAELLDRIEAFCGRHEMAETRFGREAVNNPNFLSGLRREPPVSPTLDTLNKVRDFMHKVEGEARLKQRTLEMASEPLAEEEIPLPFQRAPVNRTGASSPTSSSTSEPSTSSAANASSQACFRTEPTAVGDSPANRSCSAETTPSAGAPVPAAAEPARPDSRRAGEAPER